MHALTSEEGWLFKVDANGIVQSSKTYGKKLKLSCATETEDGGYIIGGGFNAQDSFNLPYLLRVDQKGDLLWNKTFGDLASDQGHISSIA